MPFFERELGMGHPDIHSCRSNLAAVLGGQREHAEVEAEFRTGLAGLESLLGTNHPYKLYSQFNLSLCLESLGDERAGEGEKDAARARWRDALDHARTVQAAGARVFGLEHLYLARFDQIVADLEGKLGE